MSNSKNYQRYAAAWMTLFDAFNENPYRRIAVDCPDKKAAEAMRLEFYKARDAYLHDGSMAEIYGPILNSREVTIQGQQVVFENKDRGWLGGAIEEALHKE